MSFSLAQIGLTASRRRGASSTLWDFDAINPDKWHDFTDATQITQQNISGVDRITRIEDKSTNNNFSTGPTNTSQRPVPFGGSTLNGLTLTSFDGDYLDSSTILTDVKCAFMVTNNLNGNHDFAKNSQLFGDDNDYVFIRVNTTDGDYDMSIDGRNSSTGRASANANPFYTGTNINMSMTSAECEGSNVWFVEMDNNTHCRWIGAGDLNFFRLRGEIAELVFFQAYLSADDINKGFGRLLHKYGLTDKAPINFVYKNNPPTI